MLSRSAEEKLKTWFRSEKRKPLVLRGARQVGKTTLIRMFCEKNKLQLLEVNLEFDQELRGSFLKMDPEQILTDILLYKKARLTKNTVLFIDEIQVVPDAIQGLRYFYEKRPDLAVIGAGSLLEFTLSKHEFSMPVGRVEYLFLHPMSYLEFLIARKENALTLAFQDFQWKKKMSPLVHKRLLESYYEYLVVGGMPEAVETFYRTKDLEQVKKIHRTITLNYKNDFSKYSGRIPTARLDRIFSFVPLHIGTKTKFSNIDPNEQAKNLKLGFDLLEKAGLLHRIYHTDASGLPLKIGASESVFKTIFLDVGMVSYQLGLSYQSILEIYQNTQSEVHLLHKGLISEQFVGQQLISSNCDEPLDLYYWLREGKSNNAEVDYVIQKELLIVPVEVKFGKTGNIRSLLQFVKEKKSKQVMKFTTEEPRQELKTYQEVQFNLNYLPLYLAERIYELIPRS